MQTVTIMMKYTMIKTQHNSHYQDNELPMIIISGKVEGFR